MEAGVSVSLRPSVVTATMLAPALSGSSTGAAARAVGPARPGAPAAADVVRPAVTHHTPPAGIRAVTGIALDMNTGWPAALVFRHAGTHVVGTRLSPVMHQYLNAYFSRPEKDFIAVEARP